MTNIQSEYKQFNPESKGHPVESYFLPIEDDVVVAGVDAALPNETYDDLHERIHGVLNLLASEGKVQVGEGFVGYDGWNANSVEGLTSQMVIDIVQALRAVGVEPWQVAARSYDSDEALAVYSTKNLPETWRYRGRPIDSTGCMLPDDLEAVQALLDWQYSQAYDGQFPHVSLYHLHKLATANARLLFSPVYAGFELIPVPGIQFMKYGMGGVSSGASARLIEGWDAHWGKQYAEEYKTILRETVQQYDAGIVMDVGCGEHPVTANMKNAELIVLIDSSAAVTNVSGGNRIGICLDLTHIDQIALESLVGTVDARLANGVDTIVISDVLNYLPYKVLLHSLSEILKTGGTLLISNMPEQGFSKLFSAERPKDNVELLQALQELGFLIRRVQDPLQLSGAKEPTLPISRYGMLFVEATKI